MNVQILLGAAMPLAFLIFVVALTYVLRGQERRASERIGRFTSELSGVLREEMSQLQSEMSQLRHSVFASPAASDDRGESGRERFGKSAEEQRPPLRRADAELLARVAGSLTGTANGTGGRAPKTIKAFYTSGR